MSDPGDILLETAADTEDEPEFRYPNSREVRQELNRVRYRTRFNQVLRSTIFTLIVVAAIAILIATLWLPVLRIFGSSMSPTLENGSIAVAVKQTKFKSGEIVAFYYNNKILVKRAIAQAGDWVDIDADGNVYVNGVLLDEPYITEKALGDCNIELPYQVPEDRVFVMGDNREVSIDSRNTAVGCVSSEQLVGKLMFVAWPFKAIGTIK